MTDVVLTEQRSHPLLVTMNRERAANGIHTEVHRLGTKGPEGITSPESARWGFVPSERQGWEQTERALARLTTPSDTLEGIMAFKEKRKPVWSGK